MSGGRDPLRAWLYPPPRSEPPAAAETRPALQPPDGKAMATIPHPPDMAELVARMRIAARHAGIDDDGPLTPLLDAIMLTLERLGALTDRNARITTDHAAALDIALRDARQSADAETQRFYARLEAAKAQTVRDVAHHIARSADAALTRRVRVFDRNTALIAAAVLAGGILAAFGGGYWWGSSTALAAVRETEAGLQAAFNDGPHAARTWLDLMLWNDPDKALAQCFGNAVSIQDGRRACGVPLWIEKLPSPPPPGTGR